MSRSKSQFNNDGACLLEMLADEGRYVAVIEAYLDESGTHAEAPILAVAGFYGSRNQWSRFRKLWKPFAKTLHAKDSSSLFPQLCRAIELSKVNGIVITVKKDGYREFANDHVRSLMGNTYAAVTLICATWICDNLEPRRISFSIEQGQPNTEFVRKVLEGLKEHKRLAIAAIATVEKEDFIELHSADFASHVAGTNDLPWFNRLQLSGRLIHAHLPDTGIAEAAPQISRMFKQARAERKALRRKARKL